MVAFRGCLVHRNATSSVLVLIYGLLLSLLLLAFQLIRNPVLTLQPMRRRVENRNASAINATRTPAIFVQGGLEASVGSLIDVPIAFDSAGQHVAALSFSLNYEDACLSLDPSDLDHNGLPDAITIDAPAQFFPSITINQDDQPGRMNVVLADYIAPLAALRDSAALMIFQFRIVCPLAPGLTHEALVGFAAAPAVGFSDGTGHDLPGVARDGAVQVIGTNATVTATPTQTSPPLATSPTPTAIATTPSTPIPTPVVTLETTIWPEQLTPTDRNVIVILDYVILNPANIILLTIPVPTHTYFDETASTIGWHCGSELINKQCQYTLYETTRPHRLSGRIYFAVGLNWPLPASATQIEFAVSLKANGTVTISAQQWVVPIHTDEAMPTPNMLQLSLFTHASYVVAGRDSQLRYSLNYTNSSPSTLSGVTFHLILPPAAKLHQSTGEPQTWICSPETEPQQECTFVLKTLAPAGTGQIHFIVDLDLFSRMTEISALVLVVYVSQQDRLLSSDLSIVPIQYLEEPTIRKLYLPYISGGELFNRQ
ncbi:MAG: hypothetical protein U0175_04545 [Caldilineaceae bacterium]